VHEVLSLLFRRDGVPNVMVMDGAKAQVQCDFRRKYRDAGYNTKQTEPYTAKSNLGEGEGGVHELKQGMGWEILLSGCPNHCWGDCSLPHCT
jgi:hypothetical protein